MGFDLVIHAEFMLCPDTGKPYYYGKDGNNKLICVYDLSPIVVPPEHRKFLTLRGGFLHSYTTRIFENDDILEATPATMLDIFPSWEDIKANEPDCEPYWSEADHNGFKEALEWMDSKSPIQYRLHWSY